MLDELYPDLRNYPDGVDIFPDAPVKDAPMPNPPLSSTRPQSSTVSVWRTIAEFDGSLDEYMNGALAQVRDRLAALHGGDVPDYSAALDEVLGEEDDDE